MEEYGNGESVGMRWGLGDGLWDWRGEFGA